MLFSVSLYHYLVVSGLLFSLGVFGVLARRNAIAVLLGIELMLNAGALNFIAFWRFLGDGGESVGPVFALLIITVAAAEAAVGLAIVLTVYRKFHSVNVDEVDLMEG
jgi:NADH:ubiquinone oxidoreductase subunit K